MPHGCYNRAWLVSLRAIPKSEHVPFDKLESNLVPCQQRKLWIRVCLCQTRKVICPVLEDGHLMPQASSSMQRNRLWNAASAIETMLVIMNDLLSM